MKYVVENIRLPLSENSLESLKMAVFKELGIGPSDVLGFRILKESIDARRKPDISLVYSVLVEAEGISDTCGTGRVRPFNERKQEPLNPGNTVLKHRPVVVGSGPAGMFAALTLARHGFEPLVIERGASIEKRAEAVGRYWREGVLDLNTNVLFGEGGAGRSESLPADRHLFLPEQNSRTLGLLAVNCLRSWRQDRSLAGSRCGPLPAEDRALRLLLGRAAFSAWTQSVQHTVNRPGRSRM